MELTGQTAVITGGASGLGAATARRLAAAGANVVLLDISEEAASIADEAGGAFVACDVSDASAVEAAFDHAEQLFGPARVIVCCAGVGSGAKMIGHREAHRFDIFDKVIAVNLTGTFNALREGAWRMRDVDPIGPDGERGVMITTSSIAAFDGVDGGVAYSASKGAVAAMTLPLARDLASFGIRAMSIAPGSFDTPMVAGMPDDFRSRLDGDTPFPDRFGIPDEYAQLVEQIVANSMLNGSVIRLDGGLRMRPSEGWKR